MKGRYNEYKFFFKDGSPDYDLLKKKIEVLKSAVAISNATVYLRDLYKGNYPFFSLLPTGFTGYSVDELVGFGSEAYQKVLSKEDSDLIHEVEKPMFSYIDNLPPGRKKHAVITTCHNLVHKEGHHYSVLLHITPFMFDDKGNVWVLLFKVSLAPKKFKRFFHIDMLDRKEHFEYNTESREIEKKEFFKLTKAQRNILVISNRGLLEKEMCEELNISINTLKTHKRNILKKLDADNMHEAYYLANLYRLL